MSYIYVLNLNKVQKVIMTLNQLPTFQDYIALCQEILSRPEPEAE